MAIGFSIREIKNIPHLHRHLVNEIGGLLINRLAGWLTDFVTQSVGHYLSLSRLCDSVSRMVSCFVWQGFRHLSNVNYRNHANPRGWLRHNLGAAKSRKACDLWTITSYLRAGCSPTTAATYIGIVYSTGKKERQKKGVEAIQSTSQFLYNQSIRMNITKDDVTLQPKYSYTIFPILKLHIVTYILRIFNI